MLQQISLTHRIVGNMRMPLSTSRRSKRSRGTKNTANVSGLFKSKLRRRSERREGKPKTRQHARLT